MILIGKNITTPNDALQPVAVEQLCKAIKNEDGEVAKLQNRLRYIKSIDTVQYRKMKTGLPYIVCAHFQPRVRRKENFVYTTRFLLDIDHLYQHHIDLETCKRKLMNDAQVELLYTSPGGDGLKVLFQLQDKISDAGYYAVFYKIFCQHFAQKHQLGAAIDGKTHDVSRCCFVSFDPGVYHNPDAEKVNCFDFLPLDSFNKIDLINEEIRVKEKANSDIRNEIGIANSGVHQLSDDALDRIKALVGTKVKKKQKNHPQPTELEEIMKQISEQLNTAGVVLLRSVPIAYGRQIRVGTASVWAEINVFYGGKGISIVETTKTGSNEELCKAVSALLKNHFY